MNLLERLAAAMARGLQIHFAGLNEAMGLCIVRTGETVYYGETLEQALSTMLDALEGTMQ